jgi:hypothetical protein
MRTGGLMTASRPSRGARLVLVWLAAMLAAASAEAQEWPDRPLSIAHGHVTVGGDVTLTVGSDDSGYFNFTDYERSTLRLLRFDAVATLRANAHVSGVIELRAEGDSGAGNWSADAYAVYLRVQPWTGRAFEVQAGRIPTAFGGFGRRPYGNDNLLIGYPLAYQYLTSLRPDAVPATADDLVAMRARGWLAYYPVGDVYWTHGVPPMSIFQYDTGALAKVGIPAARGELSASVTAGTLSNPGLADHNGAPQVAARFAVKPIPGLLLGASVADGAFVAREVRDVLPEGAARRQYRQRAVGADAEVSHGYWLVRTELLVTDWRLPALRSPLITAPLRATSWLTEGRYKLAPGLYVAARYDRMLFSHIQSSRGVTTWDADLWRAEAGAGYSLRRNVILKGSYQYNRRDGGRVKSGNLAAAQVLLWF